MATQDWASSSSSSSAGSKAISSCSYDVFISFRGEDIRKNFISFLYKALKDGGINVFLDSAKLWTGEEISEALERAIKGSKISIPVFSKGYADSKWCLRELAEIVQCHRSNNQLILPIFHYVDPSDVRHQTGSFENAFLEHEKKFKPHEVDGWREALRVVGNLKGEVLDDTKDQAELVESVVERAQRELVDSTGFAKCKYSTDMASRIKDLKSLLDIGSNDVRFVGICGFGGLGKTTLAQAVYNDILSTFHKHCFLSDIREQATQFRGLESLQKQFLKDIFKQDFDIGDSHRGKKLIEERVCKEKVFLVLDDVDSKEHIDALAGSLNWFGYGSRVIITTRDERILNLANIDGDKIYRPPLLNPIHSLQLFSLHAFQTRQPPEDYVQLSCDVVYHSGGLPLILEVFGSSLSCVGDKDEWESTLKMLREIPPKKVQEKLRMSYDNLENNYQKEIFLDAACFFIGWEEKDVISIWEACGFHPKSAIPRLIKRFLLKFDYGRLKMHDHIRDMGREIVLEESRNDPGKRSRLWSYDDIVEVFEEHKGTDTIRGMNYLSYASRVPINLTTESLEMMPNLRFLNVGKFKFICPNLYHRRLVYLTVSERDCNQLWNVRPPNEYKRFQNLKILKFERCRFLLMSLDFSWFPSLEQLYFVECPLVKLDESIGQLNQLKSLIFKRCTSLKKLPNSIGDLRSLIKLYLIDASIKKLPNNISRMSLLKELILMQCKSLKKFPQSISDLKELPDSICRMSSLKELILVNCTSLKKLPDSIGDLKSLIKLDLSDARILKELPDSICRMSSLKELILVKCTSLKKLPDSIGDLKSLIKLNLLNARIEELPDSICKMSSLKELNLPRFVPLKKLPNSIGDLRLLIKFDLSGARIEELPDSISRMSSLKELILRKCKLLKMLPNSIDDLKSLVKLELSYASIEELPDSISRMNSLKELILEECKSLRKLPNSIGDLKFLVNLNLSYANIEELPDSISRMSSLEQLILRWCKSLKKLPDSIGDLKSLIKLDLYDTSINELPDSISRMSSLKELTFDPSLTLKKLPNVALLEKLLGVSDFHGRIELEKLPRSMWGMRCLDRIGHRDTIDFNDDFLVPPYLLKLNLIELWYLQSLPADLSASKTLGQLTICGCYELEYLPALPSCLVELCCESCESLVRLPDLSKLKMLAALKLIDCEKLEEVPGLEEIESLDELDAAGSYNLTRTHKKIEGTLIPCNRSPTFSYGYSLTANQRICDSGIILCLVLEKTLCSLIPCMEVDDPVCVTISASIHQKHKKNRCIHTLRVADIERGTDRDVISICHFKGFTWFGVPLLQENDAIEILDVQGSGCRVKFWEVLFKNGEVIGTQKPCQNSNTLVVADITNWTYMDDDGVITLDYWPNHNDDDERPNGGSCFRSIGSFVPCFSDPKSSTDDISAQ